MKFIMMIGLPGSGKSTEAKKIAEEENAVVISSDQIRKELYGDESCQGSAAEVFSLMYEKTVKALSSNISVVYDATNISSKYRKDFLNRLKKYDIEKIAVFMATPYEECLKRNSGRDRIVPEEVIKRMYMKFNVPCKQEGFTDIKVIYSDKLISFTSIINKCKDISHDNPHHTESIGNHMIKAYENLIRNYYNRCFKEPELVFATLLHDIGKPFTKVFSNYKGQPTDMAHYYNHNNVGAYDVFLTDIPEENKINTALLIQYHMQYYISWNNSKQSEIKDRNFLGDRLSDMLDILHECDRDAH